MEVDHGEVRAPDHLRDLGHAELVGVAARGKRDAGDLDPLGALLGDALLVDLLAGDAVGKAPQLGRPLAQGAHDAVSHGEVVVDEVALRVPGLGEQHLVGVRDLDGPAADFELDEGRRHCPDPNRVAAWESAARGPLGTVALDEFGESPECLEDVPPEIVVVDLESEPLLE